MNKEKEYERLKLLYPDIVKVQASNSIEYEQYKLMPGSKVKVINIPSGTPLGLVMPIDTEI